ncbi:Dus-domain-containing protein [Flagelloscypha sp. PMI_526]|nr:Dus-domain-containing protein [Flagelloscypha sp. PMI_526]
MASSFLPIAPLNAPRKLAGYDFYHSILGSPKYIVAPMVDASELAWRRLSRRYGAQLVYTPMINAKHFRRPGKYGDGQFDRVHGEEGDPSTDRPLIVQFCAHDPDDFLESAKIVAPHCDAVDLNLGCPQDIAKRGHYGSFLQDEWDLIYRMIDNLHQNLEIPVTAKFRIFDDVDKTVEYAKMLEKAGAQILTVHGRTREQRGQNTGLASWDHIRAVKQAVSVPVFANGNILFQEDIQRCLDYTGCDAVMTAEGNLYNPLILNGLNGPPIFPTIPKHLPRPKVSSYMSDPQHLPPPLIALEYLDIVKSLDTDTTLSAVKGHLFKLLRPAIVQHSELRNKMGKIGKGSLTYKEGGLQPWIDVCEELWTLMCEIGSNSSAEVVAASDVSYWLTQPYFRPGPSWERQRRAPEPEYLEDLTVQSSTSLSIPGQIPTLSSIDAVAVS